MHLLSPEWLWLPILTHMALIIVLYFALSARKKRAVSAGRVNEARRALHDDAWPEDVIQVNNCLRNQFELPMVFYMLSIIAYLSLDLNLPFLSLAILFVLSRCVHAYMHIGANIVAVRRQWFSIGAVLVLLMFLLLTAQLTCQLFYQ